MSRLQLDMTAIVEKQGGESPAKTGASKLSQFCVVKK
jgi:hypothetical protein